MQHSLSPWALNTPPHLAKTQGSQAAARTMDLPLAINYLSHAKGRKDLSYGF